MSCTPASIRGFALAEQAESVGPFETVSGSTNAKQIVAVEHTSLRRAAFRRFLRHRLAVLGLILLLSVIAMAVFADFVSSKPYFTDVKAVNDPPGVGGHLLGTDRSGRDV